MKNVAVLLVFILIGSMSYLAYGQTRQEKKQFSLLEKEIRRAEKEISKSEKQLKKEKKLKIYELEKKINVSKKYGDPRVSPTTEHVIFAPIEQDRLNAEIDSIESIKTTSEINKRKADLQNLQLKREELISNWVSPDNSIPKEMSGITKNRRNNSFEVQRQDLGLELAKKRNANKQKREVNKVVLFVNNNYYQITYYLYPLDGGVPVTSSLPPGMRETKFVVPGKYRVEYEEHNQRGAETKELNVDPTRDISYDKENYWGFVSKER